jgi:DNA repair ATPase RecN
MRKLNCLIAVLEVANAKVRRSLEGPASDPQRLEKIRDNLSSTLEVCRRARRALDRREALPSDLPQNLAQVVRQTDIAHQARRDAKLPEGSRYEMSSAEEHARFQAMGSISEDEIGSCDLDELSRRLLP